MVAEEPVSGPPSREIVAVKVAKITMPEAAFVLVEVTMTAFSHVLIRPCTKPRRADAI